MTRTAAIAFPITVFLAWWMYVATRTGNGPGLKWDMVPNNVKFAATIVGVAYVIFLVITAAVLYFTQVRGVAVSASSVLAPAMLKLVVVFAIAIPMGSALGEWYALFEEHAFEREAEAFLATAKVAPGTGEVPMYSRKRWWPGSSQQLVWPSTK